MVTNNFEGGSTGVAISEVNAGGVSGDAPSDIARTANVTFNFDTSIAAHGVLSAKLNATQNGAGYIQWNIPSGTAVQARVAMRTYVNVSQAAPSSFFIFRRPEATDAGNAALLAINTQNILYVSGYSGGILSPLTTTMPLNTWVRFELAITSGASSTSGTLQARAYTGDSTVAFWSYDNFACDVGTSGIESVRLGRLSSSQPPFTINYDDFAMERLASGFIGPIPGAPVDPGVTGVTQPWQQLYVGGRRAKAAYLNGERIWL